MASSALEENAAELSLLDALTQLEAAALQTHVDGVPSLLGKDLLRTWDLSPEELTYLLAVVHTLEEFYKNGRNLVVFTSGLVCFLTTELLLYPGRFTKLQPGCVYLSR